MTRGRFWRTVFPAVLLAVVVCPVLVWAAKEGEHKDPNILDPRYDLGIWTLVVFGCLYLVLRFVKLPGAPKPALVMMVEGLRKREETIHGAIEDAQRARDEANRARADLQKQLDHAQEQVREILDSARKDSRQLVDDMLSKARTDIQGERDRLRREIELAKDQALQELWGRTAQLATVISAKAIRRQLSVDDHRRLVDEALGELKQAGSDWQRQAASVRG